MYRRDEKLSKSQMNRQFIDYLGFKKVSVEKFRKKITNNVPYTLEKRGMPYTYQRQKRTKVYKVGDIIDYINSEIDRVRRQKK